MQIMHSVFNKNSTHLSGCVHQGNLHIKIIISVSITQKCDTLGLNIQDFVQICTI